MKQGIAYGFSLEWNHEDYTYLKNRRKIKKSRFEDQDLQLKKKTGRSGSGRDQDIKPPI